MRKKIIDCQEAEKCLTEYLKLRDDGFVSEYKCTTEALKEMEQYKNIEILELSSISNRDLVRMAFLLSQIISFVHIEGDFYSVHLKEIELEFDCRQKRGSIYKSLPNSYMYNEVISALSSIDNLLVECCFDFNCNYGKHINYYLKDLKVRKNCYEELMLCNSFLYLVCKYQFSDALNFYNSHLKKIEPSRFKSIYCYFELVKRTVDFVFLKLFYPMTLFSDEINVANELDNVIFENKLSNKADYLVVFNDNVKLSLKNIDGNAPILLNNLIREVIVSVDEIIRSHNNHIIANSVYDDLLFISVNDLLHKIKYIKFLNFSLASKELVGKLNLCCEFLEELRGCLVYELSGPNERLVHELPGSAQGLLLSRVASEQPCSISGSCSVM